MLSIFIKLLNTKSKHEKIEPDVPPNTQNDFTCQTFEEAFTDSTADYLPFGDIQVVFGNSIYDIHFTEK